VLLENDRVRVLDTRLGSGDRTPVHARQWPGVLKILSWSGFIRYDPEGNVLLDSRTLAAKPPVGASLWSGPFAPHYVENIETRSCASLSWSLRPRKRPGERARFAANLPVNRMRRHTP